MPKSGHISLVSLETAYSRSGIGTNKEGYETVCIPFEIRMNVQSSFSSGNNNMNV